VLGSPFTNTNMIKAARAPDKGAAPVEKAASSGDNEP
jgi:hypothetical protein